MTRTSVPRKAKQKIIATIRVIAIFTIVQRRSSRCSRKGLEVSLSGSSRNLKTSRNAISADEPARAQTRPSAESVGVANSALGDHLRDFGGGEVAALQNGFAVAVRVTGRGQAHRPRQKQELALIAKTGRREKITEEN